MDMSQTQQYCRQRVYMGGTQGWWQDIVRTFSARQAEKTEASSRGRGTLDAALPSPSKRTEHSYTTCMTEHSYTTCMTEHSYTTCINHHDINHNESRHGTRRGLWIYFDIVLLLCLRTHL